MKETDPSLSSQTENNLPNPNSTPVPLPTPTPSPPPYPYHHPLHPRPSTATPSADMRQISPQNTAKLPWKGNKEKGDHSR